MKTDIGYTVVIFFTGYKYVCSVIRLLPYLTGTLIWIRGYLGSNMGLLWPLELPGSGLRGKNVVAKKIFFSHCDNLWKIGCQLFFLVVHMSPPRWGLHFLRLWYSWIWRTSARTPKNYPKQLSVFSATA